MSVSSSPVAKCGRHESTSLLRENDALWLGAERHSKAVAIVNDAQIAAAAAAGNDALLEGDFSEAQGQAHGVALLLHLFGWRIGREILQIKMKPALKGAATKNGKPFQPHLGQRGSLGGVNTRDGFGIQHVLNPRRVGVFHV